MVRLTSLAFGLSLLLLAPADALAAARHGNRGSSPAASSEHMYYNISEDPQSLELLALSDSGKVGVKMMMDVIDVTHSPKLMLGSTWQIDCAAEQMAIVHSTRVQPGSPVDGADVTPQPISARSSPKAWHILRLACDGGGDLIERRMYHGDLSQIVARFWSQ